MVMVKSKGANGNPIWITAAEVIAIENVFNDDTLLGEAENVKLLTRLHMRSGAAFDLDEPIDQVSRQFNRIELGR